MDKEILTKDVETPKRELSNLVFSFDAFFHGLLEIDVSDKEFSQLSDICAIHVLQNRRLSNYSGEPVLLYRKNPSTPYFVVDKVRKGSSDNIRYNINFESLVRISKFFVCEEKNSGYLALLLNSSYTPSSHAMVLSFKEEETIHKLTRNLLFCHEERPCTNNDLETKVIVCSDNYLYSGVDVAVRVDICEPDKNGDLCHVPREGTVFKLRRNVQKVVYIILTPLRNFEFIVERCFGLLYSVRGETLNHMRLFDDFSFEKTNQTVNGVNSDAYHLRACLAPATDAFAPFDCASDVAFSHTFSADLVVRGITGPVRFDIEIHAKMYGESEKFWLKGRGKVTKNYLVCLKRNLDTASFEMTLVSVSPVQARNETSHLSSESELESWYKKDSSIDERFAVGDDLVDCPAILSGTYSFEPDIPLDIAKEWDTLLVRWIEEGEVPKQLQRLLKYGVPSSLRPRVWPLLAGVSPESIFDSTQYDQLVTYENSYDKVIQRDVFRTFTCHEFFKDQKGQGQRQLYRVCKAYSSYDQEVGYCQGLSFIAANLLLHFDEITAFSMMVQIMYKLDHRSLFGKSFDELQCFIYIFKRLIYTHVPDLAKHFNDIGLEPTMFGPQWFLTIFTAKFPLGLVDLALDLFLSQGKRSLLQFSIAMLKLSTSDLLPLNFELALKYLCNSVPNRFSNADSCKQLLRLVHSINFTPTSFEELKIEFDCYKQDLIKTIDPVELKKIENRMLLDCQMRLEQENAQLANELVQVKVRFNDTLNKTQEENARVNKVLKSAYADIDQLNLTLSTLKDQEEILKDELRKSTLDYYETIQKKDTIIAEYKKLYCALETRESDLKASFNATIKSFEAFKSFDPGNRR